MFLWWLLDLRGLENALVRFHCLVTGLGVFACCSIPPIHACVTRQHADNGMHGPCLPSRKHPHNSIRKSQRRAHGRDACPRLGNGTVFGFRRRRDARAESFFNAEKRSKRARPEWLCRHRNYSAKCFVAGWDDDKDRLQYFDPWLFGRIERRRNRLSANRDEYGGIYSKQ